MKHLLDFPDEVLCTIFEYFSPFDALYAFINLNNRFNRLLTPFKQQIDLTSLSYEQFKYYIDTLLPILSKDGLLNVIKLGNKRTPGQIKLFNQLIDSEHDRHYFNHLDRILLESPRLEELTELVEKFLLSLSNLRVLSMQIDCVVDKDFQGLIRLITNSILPIATLTKLSIEMPSGLVLSRLSDDVMFPSLVYVNLNLSLVTDLLILIPRIPNVEKLSICISWWTSADQTIVKILDDMCTKNIDRSFLNRLKKFRLVINSTITFIFDHLERVLYRIMNDRTTSSFSLIVRNSLVYNDEAMKLIDGQQWERLLQLYPALVRFDLFVGINAWVENEESMKKLNLLNSEYFRQRNWLFSYWKYSLEDSMILYSIPYRDREPFDISIKDDTILKNFPVNYAPILSIDRIDTTKYPSIFDFIVKHFPFLQELNLNRMNTCSSVVNSIDIPSLHTLKIQKEPNINLPNLFRLFPLINTLALSYFNTDDRCRSAGSMGQYNQIIALYLSGISEMNIDEILVFLNQFPNLRFLHIYIQNRRTSDGIVLQSLNDIIQTFQSLVNLKIRLEKDIESSISSNDQLNIRAKMRFTDAIFDGVLMHLWF